MAHFGDVRVVLHRAGHTPADPWVIDVDSRLAPNPSCFKIKIDNFKHLARCGQSQLLWGWYV
jgi:hypothetical protein